MANLDRTALLTGQMDLTGPAEPHRIVVASLYQAMALMVQMVPMVAVAVVVAVAGRSERTSHSWAPDQVRVAVAVAKAARVAPVPLAAQAVGVRSPFI